MVNYKVFFGLLIALMLLPSLAFATITYDAGTNLITLDDSVGAGDSWGTAYDMEDVFSSCGAVVTKQGANAYDISARMYFADGVYFVSINEFVELKPNPTNPNYVIASHAGSHIRIGEYNANGYSENGAFWRIYSGACTGSNTNNFNGEVLIYDSSIWGDATSYLDGLHWSGVTRIYNSVLKIKSYLWNADTNLQDVKWYGTGGTYTTLYARGFTHTFAGITSINSNYGIFASGTTNADFDVYDVTFQNCNIDFYTSSGNNYLIRLINSPTFSTCGSIASGKPGMKLCFTFNVKVMDDAGNTVLGATVQLKDVDGTVVFSEQTVAGGVLANDKIITKYWYKHADQGGNKNYNDHTLKVTNGADVTEYKITIDHEIKEDIVLIPQSIASYDNIMTAINDIKGTGFVKDNDSLVNIRPNVDKILDATEIRNAQVNDVSASTTKFITNLTETSNNFWDRSAILFTSGNNKGQIRAIKHYAGGTKEVTIQTPLSNAPANNDEFIIIVARKFLTPDVAELADAVWDENHSEHTNTDSFGELLSNLNSTSGNGTYNYTGLTSGQNTTLYDTFDLAEQIYNFNRTNNMNPSFVFWIFIFLGGLISLVYGQKLKKIVYIIISTVLYLTLSLYSFSFIEIIGESGTWIMIGISIMGFVVALIYTLQAGIIMLKESSGEKKNVERL